MGTRIPSDPTGKKRNCETCGNAYDKCFEIIQYGKHYFFDSFECAIAKLAPQCEHCKTRIVGHGVEAGGSFYCCAHCATMSGEVGLRDRTGKGSQSQHRGN